jgi:microcystin degradation protein MlrC
MEASIMRIAIADISQETDTFSPIPTGLQDFEQVGLYFGGQVLEQLRGVGKIGGFLAVAEGEGGVEPLPILHARAMSGGRVTAEALEFFREKLVSGLGKVLPVDGVFLAMHGAAASEKVDDLEGYLLTAVREVIGDDIPVVVPLDHHANITHLIVESADVVVGYQTQPHDPFETGERAAKILLALIKGQISPTVGWQKIPMMALADRGLTAEWPMKEWFDLAREMEKHPKVISVSNFPMQPQLDVLEGGWAAVVYTDGDLPLAQKLAAELADKAWELREAFWALDRLPVEEAIRRAVEAEEGPILLSDTGDVILSGAPGDSTCLLKEMLKQDIPCTALLTMFDPEAVEQAMRAGAGSEVTVMVGGKRDNLFGAPVRVTARVGGISQGLKIRSHDRGTIDLGRVVLLEIGNIKMVVGQRRAALSASYPIIYRHFGLEPAEAKIVVVKVFAHFQRYHSFMKGFFRVDSPGLSGDLRRFEWARVPRPIYPLDDLKVWRAEV